MMMPGREYQAQPSRFGFNGKENDNEVKGFGNQLDFNARIYDSRLGRFLSPDPLVREAPESTPYSYVDNIPIAFIDVDGQEGDPGFTIKTANGTINIKKPLLQNISREDLTKYVQERVTEILPPKKQPSSGERVYSGARYLMKFLSAAQVALEILTYNTSGEGQLFERLGTARYNEWAVGTSFLTLTNYYPTTNAFEIFTNEPSNLPSWYLEAVKQRLMSGNATPKDWEYKDELITRGILSKRFSPSNQELGKPANSVVLGRNLERVGHVRPQINNSVAAHHIVEGTDKRAQDARDILKREGIDINDADNGVFLDMNYHNSLHTEQYRKKVINRLENAEPGKVREELRKIGEELKKGTF